jgi:hypothetical protein
MSILNNAITGRCARAPKIMIYGPPGVGKTSFAASGPNVLLLDTENGAGNVQCARTPHLASWPAARVWLQALANDEHDYATVAIDSLDWLLRRIEEHVSGADNERPEKTLQSAHGGYGNGRLVMRNVVYQQLLPLLDKLTERKICVLLTAHTRLANVTDEGVAVKKTNARGIQKAAPDIMDGFLETFIEWADMVGYVSIAGDARTIQVTDGPRVTAKNRMGLTEDIPLSWAAIMHKETQNG